MGLSLHYRDLERGTKGAGLLRCLADPEEPPENQIRL
jgi:hypothetical protein